MMIPAYTVGPHGNRHEGFIEEIWGNQVKFRLSSEEQGYWMHETHALVDWKKINVSKLEQDILPPLFLIPSALSLGVIIIGFLIAVSITLGSFHG